MSVSEAGASRVVSEEAGVVSSSGQREIDGVIVAGPSAACGPPPPSRGAGAHI